MLRAIEGIAYAHPPGRATRQPRKLNIAAGVEVVVVKAPLVQDARGVADRPALHDSGWIAGASMPDVEVAAGGAPRLLAQRQDRLHVLAILMLAQLAAIEPRDLAGLFVRAESLVHVDQVAVHCLQVARRNPPIRH